MAPNRAEVVAALIELITEQAGFVIEVTDGTPSDPEREAIWIGDIVPVTAELAYWSADDARQKRQDTYDIHLHHWAGLPGQTAVEARARAEEMAAYSDEVIATQSIDVANVLMVSVSSWDGPNIEPAGEGYIGMETIAVRIMADYI